MRLRLAILSLFVVYCFDAHPQLRNTQFFDKHGLRTKFNDSVYFIRQIRETDTGAARFSVLDTYRNGKVRLIGVSSQLEVLVLEGHCTSFYSNGQKEREGDYKQGMSEGDLITFYPNGVKRLVGKYRQGNPMGELYSYFSNGQLHTLKIYSPLTGEKNYYYNRYKLITCNDSTGKTLVANGNGFYVDDELYYQKIKEQGNIKDGLRDGEWKGEKVEKDNRIVFTEIYENGKMRKGIAVDGNNQRYTYKEREIAADYRLGMPEFYRYLGQNIHYPETARANKIAGKVFVSFFIETDGSVTGAKIVRAPDAQLGAEALRVIEASSKWRPEIEFGRPVRCQFTVPINFNLN